MQYYKNVYNGHIDNAVPVFMFDLRPNKLIVFLMSNVHSNFKQK